MEIDFATLITVLSGLFGAAGTAIAALFRAQSKAKDDRIVDFKETIIYERAEKEKARASLDAHLIQTREILSDLVGLAETIEPVVSTDGGRTRDKVITEASRVIKEVSSELRHGPR